MEVGHILRAEVTKEQPPSFLAWIPELLLSTLSSSFHNAARIDKQGEMPHFYMSL